MLYDFLIPSGAEIMGTVRRQPMFPFTFDQKLKATDCRQDVPVKGQKALLLKNLKISNKQISAFAYRDGKGGVVLGLNSMIRRPDWDLVVVNQKDAERFRRPSAVTGERIVWFQDIDEQSSSDNEELFF